MKIEAIGDAVCAEIDEISAAQVIRLHSGDILALVTDDYIGDAGAARLRSELRSAIPGDVKVIVVERAHFEVIRQEQA